jgi:hypothetical protein
MRLTEFWDRLERHLGGAYASSWARDVVLDGLDGRTAERALADGVATGVVWRAVARTLELPPGEER